MIIRPSLFYKVLVLLVSALLAFNSVAKSSGIEIKIALRAHQGAEEALKKWGPTAEYLTNSIPGYHFVMIPFEQNAALDQAVSQGDFDFILTNPSATVEHKVRYQTKQLTTLVNKRQGQGYMQFGSVIFVRADNHAISTLEDLKGKIFMAADEKGFGGWRIPWLEFLNNDIDPFRDFKQIRFASGIQQKVIYAVRDGDVDAGSVRTDKLERLAAKGLIDLKDYKIIGQKKRDDFKFLLSTDLYPEWAFSQANGTSNSLAVKVLYALLDVKENSAAASAGHYMGWVRALDYSSVQVLLQELGVEPFQRTSYSVWNDFWAAFGIELIIVIVLIMLMTGVLVYQLVKRPPSRS